jgi:hypothetical protein
MKKEQLFVMWRCVLCLMLVVFMCHRGIGQKAPSRIKYSADYIEGSGGKEAQRMLGHVVFTQDSVIMYCDSAWMYPNNSLEAYTHVHQARRFSQSVRRQPKIRREQKDGTS